MKTLQITLATKVLQGVLLKNTTCYTNGWESIIA